MNWETSMSGYKERILAEKRTEELMTLGLIFALIAAAFVLVNYYTVGINL